MIYNLISLWRLLRVRKATSFIWVATVLLIAGACSRDYIAAVGPKVVIPNPTSPPVSSTTACPCLSTPGSTTSIPASLTGTATAASFDTLNVPPPRFLPNGGTFYLTVSVRLTADTLPPGAVIDYSLDNGQNWNTGQQVTITSGGTLLTRIRAGNKLSVSRSASFSIYFRRMLVIGNSIMNHGPAPELGWFNNNGMAASAPEKDFLHILTARLRTLYPAFDTRLQASGNLERYYGKSSYSLDEFNEPVQQFRPDLILVRMGENVDDGQVGGRNFEGNFRQFLERLASLSGSQPVKIVVTTSVWSNPNADAVIRKVAGEKGYTLVDLSCMVGQGQYFASQYADPGVAAHPNDTGMQRIADMIWDKIQ